MNIPKLLEIPEQCISELGVFSNKELPVLRSPTVILTEDELSAKLCIDVEDLHATMRRKEKSQKYHNPYNFPFLQYFSQKFNTLSMVRSDSSEPSSQIEYRGTSQEIIYQCRTIVVDWMSQVGTSYSLSNWTIHFAVALMDRVLSEMSVSKGMIQLVATGCILVACKNEERDEKIPSMDQLNYCTDNTYTPQLIKEMETVILNRVNWDLNMVTPIHFLGLYLDHKQSLTPDELILEQPIGDTYDRVKVEVASFAEFFVDLCRQDFKFLEFPPSIIAASSIAVTRKMLRITPVWSRSLETLTTYNFEELCGCCEQMWTIFEANYILPGSPRAMS